MGALTVAALASALVIPTLMTQNAGAGAAAVAANLAYPVFDIVLFGFVVIVFGLTGWRPDRVWLLLGLRHGVQRGRGQLVPVPGGRRDVHGGRPAGLLLAGGHDPHGAGRVAARRRGPADPAGGQARAGPPHRVRAGRPRDGDLRPLRARQPTRRRSRVRQRCSPGRPRSHAAHVPREPGHAPAEPRRGDDRPADRPGQPAPADGRPRGGADRPVRRASSSSSTSTASRATTTRSAIRPATRCCAGSEATSPRPWPTTASCTAWVATSSAR